MSERVVVPGGRDVRATLDGPEDHRETEAVVVACPPHPQLGGSRSDPRLRAVSDALVDRGVACLRFDYGAWDEGHGEVTDATNALAWASDRYAAVGLFGYSFGGSVALLAAAREGDDGTPAAPAATAALAPAAELSADLSAVDALDSIRRPVQIVYGERDDTVDWMPVVERARALEKTVESVAADHHFVGQREGVAATVSRFLYGHLNPSLSGGSGS